MGALVFGSTSTNGGEPAAVGAVVMVADVLSLLVLLLLVVVDGLFRKLQGNHVVVVVVTIGAVDKDPGGCGAWVGSTNEGLLDAAIDDGGDGGAVMGALVVGRTVTIDGGRLASVGVVVMVTDGAMVVIRGLVGRRELCTSGVGVAITVSSRLLIQNVVVDTKSATANTNNRTVHPMMH